MKPDLLDPVENNLDDNDVIDWLFDLSLLIIEFVFVFLIVAVVD